MRLGELTFDTEGGRTSEPVVFASHRRSARI